MSNPYMFFDPNRGSVPIDTSVLFANLSGWGDTTKYMAGDGTFRDLPTIPPQTLFVSDVITLNAAALAAIDQTPVSVVAAPGANKLLVPDVVAVDFRYATAAYTGTGLDLYLGDTPLGMFDNNTITAAASETFVKPCGTAIKEIARADAINQPLVISSSGAYADGGGTIRVVVYYKVVNFGA